MDILKLAEMKRCTSTNNWYDTWKRERLNDVKVMGEIYVTFKRDGIGDAMFADDFFRYCKPIVRI